MNKRRFRARIVGSLNLAGAICFVKRKRGSLRETSPLNVEI